jgi:hypothetical protein
VNSGRLLPLLAVGLALAAASCRSDRNASDPGDALDQQVCTQSDVGAGYRQQTSGDFSLNNVADLSSDPGGRRLELEADGLQHGHFAYWKHSVGSPPFKPPLEIVCQVLEFATDEQAQQFVAQLRAEPDDLATSAMTWLPDGKRTIEERPLSGSDLLPAAARGFHLEARDSNIDVSVYALVAPAGRYVRSVYVGDGDDSGSLAEAMAIQVRVRERLK